MEGTAHRWASPGELVAYALPPGFHWLEILAAHAQSGASFLPIDVRLSEREQERLIDRARSAWRGTMASEDSEQRIVASRRDAGDVSGGTPDTATGTVALPNSLSLRMPSGESASR